MKEGKHILLNDGLIHWCSVMTRVRYEPHPILVTKCHIVAVIPLNHLEKPPIDRLCKICFNFGDIIKIVNGK
jgi:hypothetical protein